MGLVLRPFPTTSHAYIIAWKLCATIKTQDVTDTETSPMVRHLSATEVDGDAKGE